ncbi:MAG: HAD hydrolase-like protein [Gemmatimonadetes bacterium]|nr:HAD hydrolase-like protein [Gemmatimonadota bacterium]
MTDQRPLLTFDCYGTLIDWEAGILAGMREAYGEATEAADEDLFSDFLAAQDNLKTGSYRTYRQLLAEVAASVAAARGWARRAGAAELVPASVPGWTPFPDTCEALAQLQEGGFALGILSNIDNDLLAGTLEHFPVRFDLLGTAQNLRSYKPGRAHFDLGRSWSAGRERWLHVAQSLFHDIIPATKLGLASVWINRKHEPLPPEARPERTFPNLASAADWLTGRPAAG